jgi:NADH-ubiquinone oxidoreductase chain 5
MLIAGLRALTECDIKKIIALSTLSQLGLMILAIGINMPNLAYFHILTHALFKALLFICAGSLINYHNHTQDLR